MCLNLSSRASERAFMSERFGILFNCVCVFLDIVDVVVVEDVVCVMLWYDFDGDVCVVWLMIEGVGYGLFARRRLATGDVVERVMYLGDVLSLVEVLKFGDDEKVYVMVMYFNVYVDVR